jgi:tagatose 6-phosphate kinase
MILTVTANPLLDHVCSAAITPGDHHRVDRFSMVAGGKGLNVSRVLAAHGHAVQAVFFAGGRSGDSLTELVASDGVDPVPVATAAATRIGFLAVNAYGRPPTAVLEPGFAVSRREIGALLAQVRSRIAGADLVICAGSVSHADAEGLWRMVCDACAHAGVPCWVDSYGPAMDACLTGANPPVLAKPNRQEYGRGGRRWAAPAELHRTDGAGQVVVRTPTARIVATPPRIDAVNPVGSGDCYVAALAHARLAGWNLERQVAYAVAAGAANAARADVARIGPRDIAALSDQVQIASDGGRPA